MINKINSLTPENISQLAVGALLYEAALAPKPGLVDPQSTGAHKDMDFFTFIDSSLALGPYFTEYVRLGMEHRGTLPALFLKVRQLGLQAEKAMLIRTKQVNTHKGANFSFALFLSSLGFFLQVQPTVTWPLTTAQIQQLFQFIQAMTAGLVTKDFAQLHNKKNLSYGEHLYVKYGLAGIRQEAENGYPLLRKLALPYLRTTINEPKETRLLLLLLKLMQETEDSNLINRGGIEAWQRVKQKAEDFYSQACQCTNIIAFKALLTQFDQQMIQEHLSPGGSADLLALSIFLGNLEGIL
jgi:triphosphoribosyl-dephospho-CoA synthase